MVRRCRGAVGKLLEAADEPLKRVGAGDFLAIDQHT